METVGVPLSPWIRFVLAANKQLFDCFQRCRGDFPQIESFQPTCRDLQWHGQWKEVQIVVATLLNFASFSLRDSTVQGATLAYGDDPPCKDLRAFARISCEQLLMIWAMMFPLQLDRYSVFDCMSWIGLQQKLQIHSAKVSLWTINVALECHQLGAPLFHARICHEFRFFSCHLRYTRFGHINQRLAPDCSHGSSRKQFSRFFISKFRVSAFCRSLLFCLYICA